MRKFTLAFVILAFSVTLVAVAPSFVLAGEGAERQAQIDAAEADARIENLEKDEAQSIRVDSVDSPQAQADAAEINEERQIAEEARIKEENAERE